MTEPQNTLCFLQISQSSLKIIQLFGFFSAQLNYLYLYYKRNIFSFLPAFLFYDSLASSTPLNIVGCFFLS